MEKTKIELPAWLPWTTTACVAALVACLVELWMIEKVHSQLLKDDGLLAKAELKSMSNRLEAERIISRREIEKMGAAAKAAAMPRVALLAAPDGAGARTDRPTAGAVAWNPTDGKGMVRLSGASLKDSQKDFQLWLAGPDGKSSMICGVFAAGAGSGPALVHVDPVAAEEPGSRFLLIEGAPGGPETLEAAKARGSIILASPALAGRISP